MIDDQLIKDVATIGFLLIAVIILLKILYEVRKQQRTIKELQFELHSHDITPDEKEEKHG